MANENESLFLAFRRFFPIPERPVSWVEDEAQIIDCIEQRIRGLSGRIGVLLSSGVDSAILARFLPAGSIAYTMDYEGVYQKRSEFSGASRFVPNGVKHKRIIIERQAYFDAIEALTEGRRAPTVPHEAAVYLAAQGAKQDGVEFLIAGFGADSRLGGFSELYRTPSVEAFKAQLFSWYIDPSKVLVNPAPVDWVFDKYSHNGVVDIQRFLTEVGTEGNSAREAIELCGVVPVTPYTEMAFAKPFDSSQESKYLLNNAFKSVYGESPPFKKFALWVPYNDWFGGIRITRPEFLPGCMISEPVFTGEPTSLAGRMARRAWRELSNRLLSGKRFHAKQGYLMYSLERYFEYKERHQWETPSPHSY